MIEQELIQEIPVGRAATPPPPVVLWYRIYCGGMAAMYLLVLLLGLFMTIAPAILQGFMKPARGAIAGEMMVNMATGVVYSLMGLMFFLVYLIGAILPARSWTWIAGLVLIALSFTSCCCLPMAIPLLIYWIKDETKAWFAEG